MESSIVNMYSSSVHDLAVMALVFLSYASLMHRFHKFEQIEENTKRKEKLMKAIFVLYVVLVMVSVYRSVHEAVGAAIKALVFLLCGDLMHLVFYCFHKFEQIDENTKSKEKLLKAICVLTVVITTWSTYRVAAIKPPAVAVLLWSMNGLCIFRTLYSYYSVCGKSGMVEAKHR